VLLHPTCNWHCLYSYQYGISHPYVTQCCSHFPAINTVCILIWHVASM